MFHENKWFKYKWISCGKYGYILSKSKLQLTKKGGGDIIPDIKFFSHFPLYLLDKLMIESFPFFRTHSCGTATPISKVRLQIFQHIRKSENLIPPKLVKIVKPQTGETSESYE